MKFLLSETGQCLVFVGIFLAIIICFEEILMILTGG